MNGSHMDRLQQSLSDAPSVYDNYARRLISHMRESRRLLDSFTLQENRDSPVSQRQIEGRH
ncbi:hypothetical protein [Rhizobium sp. Root1220]|uniref:hypothetical protein n=1 Tax=Rhizobium sp. Root1220 TaxID=1736432 RepID=UPI0006FE17BB|nr:hypothetical protein [Rhizobium sp. Root1220]KQV83606.1 hypothetical protein ASC90_20165 [Rhizobium sp. Root1220]